MRIAVIPALLLAACSPQAPDSAPDERATTSAEAAGWDLEARDEGAALILAGSAGEEAIRLYCPAGEAKLVVNVPGFTPIGSEERLSFGQNGEVVALVADPSGDQERGGVTAEGAVPDNLVALLSGRVSASYGAQASGPHPPPPAALVNGFVEACSEPAGSASPTNSSSADDAPSQTARAASVGACRTQDGEVLAPNRLKAVGTEPFWAARIEGRCVTYMTPENQSGTRIWTQFSGSAESGVWKGFYQNKDFVLRTRSAPGCSDGMSDKRYPIAVTVQIGGEQRSGCAHWL